jgi:hypothetical protein
MPAYGSFDDNGLDADTVNDCDNIACPDGGATKCGGVNAIDSSIKTWTVYWMETSMHFHNTLSYHIY